MGDQVDGPVGLGELLGQPIGVPVHGRLESTWEGTPEPGELQGDGVLEAQLVDERPPDRRGLGHAMDEDSSQARTLQVGRTRCRSM